MCPHTLWDAADGLACLRTDDHDTGHIYGAAWCPDAHDAYDPEGDR